MGPTATRGENLSPVAVLLSAINLGGLPPYDPAALGVTFGGVMGEILFLPLAADAMRHRLKLGRD